jgi:YHS domain-containing protein
MIRYLIELLFPLLLVFFIRAVLRNIFASFQAARGPQQRPTREPPPVQAGGELKKDPVCGTYVSTDASVTRMVNGEMVHFCSKECREKYRAA